MGFRCSNLFGFGFSLAVAVSIFATSAARADGLDGFWRSDGYGFVYEIAGDKLRSYDLFLRDRTVFEWWKDNAPAVRWMRSATSRATHDESHEFWAHLDEGEKRQRALTGDAGWYPEKAQAGANP